MAKIGRKSPEKPSLNETLGEWFPNAMRYGGLAIAIYEVLVEKVDRPSILVLAGGMMGLKEVVRFADSRKNGNGDTP